MSSLIAKTAGGIGCAVLGLPLLAVLTVAALLGSALPGSSMSAAPSKHALADIPPSMLALYQRAAPECPGLAWTVPAAIGKVETDHGRHPTMLSPAGAVGPMQFLPSTFMSYAYPVPPGGKKPPTPWDPIDAVYAAVRLLCANGAKNGRNLRRAIWHYNHSDAYVDQVLQIADEYSQTAPSSSVTCASLQSTVQSGSRFSSAAALKAVQYACSQLGAPYVWGGEGKTDGGFDCSGLTQAAYRAAGIAIPRVAQTQYNAGPRLLKGAPLEQGDLLFFGTSPSAITHVALYTGGGRAIDAPHSGAVVREGPANTNTASFQGATRPTARGGAR